MKLYDELGNEVTHLYVPVESLNKAKACICELKASAAELSKKKKKDE